MSYLMSVKTSASFVFSIFAPRVQTTAAKQSLGPISTSPHATAAKAAAIPITHLLFIGYTSHIFFGVFASSRITACETTLLVSFTTQLLSFWATDRPISAKTNFRFVAQYIRNHAGLQSETKFDVQAAKLLTECLSYLTN